MCDTHSEQINELAKALAAAQGVYKAHRNGHSHGCNQNVR